MIHKIFEPSASQYAELCQRPSIDQALLTTGIQTIFNEIKRNGDAAVRNYTEKFDGICLPSSVLDLNGISLESINISIDLKEAIQTAYANIYKFHEAQKTVDIEVKTMEGINCSLRSVPIEKVGIYIPGGTAPLFSTVLMLAIPAQIAGCGQVILCTPPDKLGNIHPAILYAALLCGNQEIRLVGGAQAIAAMTFGTKEIPAVAKIFGPGNQYVTAAKQLAQNYGVAIDMPAGPSEVLVYGDATSVPAFMAADLLAQAEHGTDSQVMLVLSDKEKLEETLMEIEKQMEDLPRKSIAKQALAHSKAIVIADVNNAFDFINQYAPEHLIIASEKPSDYIPYIKNAGSVFLGNYCPESAGDYASGTNHTLPTNGWARSYSGVNLDAFTKKISFQSITKEGIQSLGKTIITMAEGEQLQAHANAVKVRLAKLSTSI
ncbi:MAG TPA: histidinol dehydrogenase [Saprospiraceae bacterium]|nr:histidinol dehydrogenase [Saprospiraceae bacterium]